MPWGSTGTGFPATGTFTGAVGKLAFILPSGDPTGGTDAANISAALSAGQTPLLTPGTFNTNSTVTFNPGQYMWGFGRNNTTINWRGSGDCIRAFGSSAVSSADAGGFGGFTVNGSAHAVGASSGFHLGDMFQLDLDIEARNFTGAGDIGVWLDNQHTFTEQVTGKIYTRNCASGTVLDNSTGTALSAGATGSFDRFCVDIFVVTNGLGDALRLQNGAFIIDGDVGLFGNMSGGAAQFAALTITGSNAGGFSLISGSTLRFGVELIAGGIAPYTINFGTAGSNTILGCGGIMDFSANATFTSANNFLKSFQFDGPIYGDTKLQRSMQLGQEPFDIAPLANGSLINTRYTGLTRVSAAAPVTGIILEGFNPDDWRQVTVINHGAGTITFDVPATSHVADGTSDVIAANSGATFHWSVNDGLWYRAY